MYPALVSRRSVPAAGLCEEAGLEGELCSTPGARAETLPGPAPTPAGRSEQRRTADWAGDSGLRSFSGASTESCDMPGRWEAERGEGVEAGRRPGLVLIGLGRHA